eukprot:TRINITY_DN2504_c0_g4_i3.p1 TRINITY_DN2504_c0_g4~~TRINITY_DN2504_c0_g4_i3.p1  ORF type:complete len:110 (-),score=6.71 TRINITY_DN2504_c0_g4_i3:280-609(-)
MSSKSMFIEEKPRASKQNAPDYEGVNQLDSMPQVFASSFPVSFCTNCFCVGSGEILLLCMTRLPWRLFNSTSKFANLLYSMVNPRPLLILIAANRNTQILQYFCELRTN